MDINITLFIQIIHFYLVYFFLDKFFFWPFVSHIKKQKHGYQTVIEKLQEKERVLFTLQENKTHQLFQFQEHVKENYQIPPKPIHEPPSLTLQNITPEKIKQAQESIKAFIVERICHAR